MNRRRSSLCLLSLLILFVFVSVLQVDSVAAVQDDSYQVQLTEDRISAHTVFRQDGSTYQKYRELPLFKYMVVVQNTGQYPVYYRILTPYHMQKHWRSSILLGYFPHMQGYVEPGKTKVFTDVSFRTDSKWYRDQNDIYMILCSNHKESIGGLKHTHQKGAKARMTIYRQDWLK